MSNYDPKTEVSISGTVDRITQHTGDRGWPGTHLFVKTGTIEVHVGPADYIASQQFSFAVSDIVEVTGSKVKMQEKDGLLAREIKWKAKPLSCAMHEASRTGREVNAPRGG